MYSIELRFSGSTSPQLDELIFCHPANQGMPRVSQRGRVSLGAGPSRTTFNWTAGLRAFCILVIAAARAKAADTIDSVTLTGEAGTWAAALDSAIAKNAQWVSDCFGTDSNGDLIIRRLITRVNPERKRPGPVSVGFSPAVLHKLDIIIEINGRQASSHDELLQVEQLLESRVIIPIRGEAASDLTTRNLQSDSTHVFRCVEEAITADTLNCLRAVNVFDPLSLRERYSDIAQLPAFQRVARRIERLNTPLDRELRSCDALGLRGATSSANRKDRKQSRQIRILLPGSTFSSVAVLEHVRSKREFEIELDYHFSHANEVLQLLLAGEEPDGLDACVVSLGQLARFLSTNKKTQFEPLMMMPPVSMHLLSPRLQKGTSVVRQRPSRVHLLLEGGTSSSIFMEQVSSLHSNLRGVALAHCEPMSFASLLLRDPSNRVVAWSPYAALLSRIVGVESVSFGALSMKDNFLLVHKRILRDDNFARVLDRSIRDSWLTLIEHPDICRGVVTRLLRDPEFSTCLRRWIGWDMTAERL